MCRIQSSLIRVVVKYVGKQNGELQGTLTMDASKNDIKFAEACNEEKSNQ